MDGASNGLDERLEWLQTAVSAELGKREGTAAKGHPGESRRFGAGSRENEAGREIAWKRRMLNQKRVDSQTATLQEPRAVVVRVLFLGVCLVVAYATLLPFRFTLARVVGEQSAWPHIVLQTHSPTPLSDLVGNVALFLPVGALAWMGLHRGRPQWEALGRAALAGATFSFAIEVLQCFTPTRTPAVSDVLANSAGSLLGALAASLSWPRLRTRHSVAALVRSSRREPLLMALAGLVILVSIQAVLPFDYSLHPRVLRRALRMVQIDPRLDPAPWIDTSRLLLFALLGGVTLRVTRLLSMCAILVRIGMSLGLVAALALALELVQILFKSQILALQDGLAAVAGGAVGVAVALLVTRGPAARHAWSLVTLAYALVLLLATTGILGASGTDVMEVRMRSLIPLYADHFDATLADVSQFTDVFLLFIPLGFLLARDFGCRWRQLSWNAGLVTLACMTWAALRHLLVSVEAQGLGAFSWSAAAALGGFVGGTSWLWFEASRETNRTGQKEVASLRKIA